MGEQGGRSDRALSKELVLFFPLSIQLVLMLELL